MEVSTEGQKLNKYFSDKLAWDTKDERQSKQQLSAKRSIIQTSAYVINLA